MEKMPDLPDEICLDIFERSVAYHSAYNQALSLGPNSTWSRILRHKKSLVLVNKRWNRLATPLLYQEVVLRRVSQLRPLQDTLSSSNLGDLVEILTFTEGCETDPEHGKFTPADLREDDPQIRKANRELENSIICNLPIMCPRLRRINFRSHISLNTIKSLLSHPCLTGVTDFGFGESINDIDGYYDQLGPSIFAAAHKIRYLSLHDVDPQLFRYEDEDNTPEFPVLEELRIIESARSLPFKLSFPQLKRFTHTGYMSAASLFSERHLTQLFSFLQKNGKNLEYLAILGAGPSTYPPLSSIFAHCPKITHLVLEQLPIPIASDIQAQFTSVRRLDLYAHPVIRLHPRDDLPRRIACFPNLESIHLVREPRSFENVFSSLPVPHDVDVVEAFKEACDWIKPPKTSLHNHTAASINDSDADGQRVLAQDIKFVIEKEGDSDDDSDYSASTSESSSQEEDSYLDEWTDHEQIPSIDIEAQKTK